jgi:hypothetical protein
MNNSPNLPSQRPTDGGGPAEQARPDDDKVLWIVIAFCLLVPVGLATLWALSGYWYPPMILAMLLGIAVAALTYRYLGGSAKSEFKVGLLKLTGSAALLIGTAWFANEGLSKQMETENLPKKLKAVNAALDAASSERDKLKIRVGEQEATIAGLRSKGDDDLLKTVEAVPPGEKTAQALIVMAKEQRGPFSRTMAMTLRVTVIGSLPRGRFFACDDRKLRGATLTLTSKAAAQDGQYPSVTGAQAGSIQVSVCQQANRRFDLQMACEDGLLLFPAHIQSCDAKKRAVKWRKPNGERDFDVLADVVRNEGD